MPFIIPKFIDREAKIVGPLTFKQFFFFVIGGVVIAILYFSFGKKNVVPFIILSALAFGISFLFSFANVVGRPFPVFVKNVIMFSIAPKFFTFKKKIFAPKLFPEEIPRLKKEATLPKSSGKSSLRDLSTRVQTKNR